MPKEFFILTTVGKFEVSEDTMADVRASYDHDAPAPFIGFNTVRPEAMSPALYVEVAHGDVRGFAETVAE